MYKKANFNNGAHYYVSRAVFSPYILIGHNTIPPGCSNASTPRADTCQHIALSNGVSSELYTVNMKILSIRLCVGSHVSFAKLLDGFEQNFVQK
jgi:hypothetical protein